MSFMPASGQIVIYDTEFTSWAGYRESRFRMPGRFREVIEIGAVRLDASDGLEEQDAFEILVRPVKNPMLSDYITELTGITQRDIDDNGVPFPDALDRFRAFLGDGEQALFSYGRDGAVMAENCHLNGIETPLYFDDEHNIRQAFVELGLVEASVNSGDLPDHFGLANGEPSHRALADARSLADVLRHLRDAGKI